MPCKCGDVSKIEFTVPRDSVFTIPRDTLAIRQGQDPLDTRYRVGRLSALFRRHGVSPNNVTCGDGYKVERMRSGKWRLYFDEIQAGPNEQNPDFLTGVACSHGDERHKARDRRFIEFDSIDEVC